MGIYVLKRLLGAIPTLVIASLLVFAFIHLIPGDPASVMLGDMAGSEEIEELRHALGLDRPIWEQYLLWVSRVLQGDLGSSIYFQEPVLRVIGEGAETSAFLALFTMILIITIGIPAGIVSATSHGTRVDQGLSGLTMLAASIPTFWLGLYLIFTVAVGLDLLPTSGFPSVFETGDLSNFKYLILPAVTLSASNAALVIRLVRAGMLDVMREDYVRTARAKGIAERAVIIRHVFRNALIGVVATLGFTFVGLVSEAAQIGAIEFMTRFRAVVLGAKP
jgi:peptide/nickel transport system permease protein